jgi:thioredoxin-related protein
MSYSKSTVNKLAIFLLLALPFRLFAQDTGLRFSRFLSWQQVLQKAKAENKYIFLDCFATWCGPCKAMDKDVYPLKQLGDEMNDRFICVKVQMDKTDHDAEDVKNWYADAQAIQQQYQVNAFPTFLFFSPDGAVQLKDEGYKRVNEMVALSKAAQTSDQQYQTLIVRYQNGQKNYPHLDELAEKARTMGDLKTANLIAADYMDHYLMQLSPDSLYTQKSIYFILSFPDGLHSGSKAFRLFYPDGQRVDQTLGKPAAQRAVDYVISAEYIEPEFSMARREKRYDIDWMPIQKAISHGFDAATAKRNIAEAKSRWYHYMTQTYNKDWEQYIRYQITVIEKYEQDTSVFTDVAHNNFAYDAILPHSTDKKQLELAVHWMKVAIGRVPLSGLASDLDTYANLLYKLGETRVAITQEEKAHHLLPDNQEIATHLEKMKKGVPTWIQR